MGLELGGLSNCWKAESSGPERPRERGNTKVSISIAIYRRSSSVRKVPSWSAQPVRFRSILFSMGIK